MAVEIKVPSVGESVSEATLSRWLKPEGTWVQANEPVCELDTEKASTEVMAPVAGLLKISIQEGETVAIGTVLGSVDESARKPAPGANRAKKKGVETAPPPPEPKPEPKPEPEAEQAEEAPAALMTPSARQLAASRGIDPGQLEGSGRGGRILKEDVQAYLDREQPGAPPEKAPEAGDGRAPPLPAQAPAAETRERMTPIRQRIAERLVVAQQTAAILTTFNEADLSAVLGLRARYKESFQKKHGVGLGFMSFFVKACVEALRAFPLVNARLDGSDIVYQHACHIGVAVSTERGLLVPVLRNADQLGFAEIEKGIAALAGKAREGTIRVDDLQGGTFTITNGGVFGSLLSTPILNPPQVGILGMHTIQKRPVVVDDAVVIRPMMYLALSYDHRLIDGREAVRFLVRVKECIEAPERLLLEV
jgi:2-oxoglutarate dehydrogenase E2 component (dihydrolipoamide succinyltransferase)